MKNLVIFFLIISPFAGFLHAQTAAQQIVVHGRVYDAADSSAVVIPIIINHRTGAGQCCVPGQSFSMSGLQTDTFFVRAAGYEMTKICFRDSAEKNVYNVTILMKPRNAQLATVIIYPVKDLSTIRQERSTLGVVQTTMTHGLADAVNSPITYAYERLSREGRSKALVAKLEDEYQLHEVLTELLRTYVKSGVIDLKEEEFDSFITFLNLPEWYIKTANDYDLAETIRQRYLQYRAAQQFHAANQR